MTVAEQVRSEDRSVVESELDEPIWSVISFERVEAVGLGYDEATGLLSELEDRGVPGLCIVTIEAAARVKTPELPSQNSRSTPDTRELNGPR